LRFARAAGVAAWATVTSAVAIASANTPRPIRAAVTSMAWRTRRLWSRFLMRKIMLAFCGEKKKGEGRA